jgi:DNA modification methylase
MQPKPPSTDDSTAVFRVLADARNIPLGVGSVDLCLTSPPYWRKRRYGHPLEIGQEKSPAAHGEAMRNVLQEIRRVLKPTGSLFLNLGDTYHRRSLAGIPYVIENAAREEGWRVRNRIIWAKPNGVPSPHQDRLPNRHEVVLHLTGEGKYYYDLNALSQHQGTRFPGGDIWEIGSARHVGSHPAAFPSELAARVIALACPTHVCRRCGRPRMPISGRTIELNPNRPQAQRALQLYVEHGLTKKHIAAIRATGISDAGKAKRLQTGSNGNSSGTVQLAREAKKALGGYFREFTFGRRMTIGHQGCGCGKGWQPGLVLDVFAGTGTTVLTAWQMNKRAIGIDLLSWDGVKTKPRIRRAMPTRIGRRRRSKKRKAGARRRQARTLRPR